MSRALPSLGLRIPSSGQPAGAVATPRLMGSWVRSAYAKTDLADARLAGIDESRIINVWALDRLLDWLSDKSLD